MNIEKTSEQIHEFVEKLRAEREPKLALVMLELSEN